MAALSHKGASLEQRLLAAVQVPEITEISQEMHQINLEMQQLEEKWLNLSTQVEDS